MVQLSRNSASGVPDVSPQWSATLVFFGASLVHWANGYLIFQRSYVVNGWAGEVFHATFDASLHCVLHTALLGCIVCGYGYRELVKCMWLRLLFEAVLAVHDWRCGADTAAMIYNRYGGPDTSTRSVVGPCIYVAAELAVTVAAAGADNWHREVRKMCTSLAVLLYVVLHVVYISLADVYLHHKDSRFFHLSHFINVLTALASAMYYWKAVPININASAGKEKECKAK